jgi:hypothetical protein
LSERATAAVGSSDLCNLCINEAIAYIKHHCHSHAYKGVSQDGGTTTKALQSELQITAPSLAQSLTVLQYATYTQRINNISVDSGKIRPLQWADEDENGAGPSQVSLTHKI